MPLASSIMTYKMSSTTPTKARETAAGSTRLPSDAEMDVTAIESRMTDSDSNWTMSGDEDADIIKEKSKTHIKFYFEEGNLYLLVGCLLKMSVCTCSKWKVNDTDSSESIDTFSNETQW